MFSRILIPYDGSARSLSSLPAGRSLGSGWGCPVELVHVGDHDPPPPSTPEPLHRLDGADPAASLRAAATGAEAGLLCMATRGRTAASEMLAGSVAGEVVRDLHAPIVLVGPTPQQVPAARSPRLLLCLDGSAVAESIVPTVRTWADALESEVRVLHVAPPLPDPREGDFVVPEDTRHATSRVEAVVEELRDAGIEAQSTIAEHPDVPGRIVAQASSAMADLVVMATHGRTGLARMLVGSVARQVIARSPLPVLVQRPGDLA